MTPDPRASRSWVWLRQTNQQPSEALVQQLAVPERRTYGKDPMERVQMAMYSKKRAGGSFRGNTYFPPWKIRDLDPRLHAIWLVNLN